MTTPVLTTPDLSTVIVVEPEAATVVVPLLPTELVAVAEDTQPTALVVEPVETVVVPLVEKTEVVAVVAEGPQGPPGSYNGPTIFVGPTPPSDTSLLWVDISEELLT